MHLHRMQQHNHSAGAEYCANGGDEQNRRTAFTHTSSLSKNPKKCCHRHAGQQYTCKNHLGRGIGQA